MTDRQNRWRHRPGPAPASRPAPGRWPLIDAARGAALVGMIAYHLDWDLAYLRWLDADPAGSAFWTALGDLVAGTFLFLSGFSLVLAAPKGWVAAVRRLAVVAGAALLVTAATAWLFPADVIVFGILHCIAATNLLALVLLRAPWPVVSALAASALAAPFLATLPPGAGAVWSWTGLSPTLPRTLDYRPLLPWLGVVLGGVICARALGAPDIPSGRGTRIDPTHAQGHLLATLRRAGRHSLAVYLLHQPALLGLLIPLAALIPLHGRSERADFAGRCRTECVGAGAPERVCATACACASARLGRGAEASPDDLGRAAAGCLRTTADPLAR